MARFVAVLHEALPVRDAAELRAPGSPAVSVERRERPWWSRVREIPAGTVVAVAFCLVMAVLLIAGPGQGALFRRRARRAPGNSGDLIPVGADSRTRDPS